MLLIIQRSYTIRGRGRHDHQEQGRGKAWQVDDSGARLKVCFFRSFGGNNWIVGQDVENYSYAVVSEPKGKYLRIITYTPRLDRDEFDRIIEPLMQDGFDLSRLVVTGGFEQDCGQWSSDPPAFNR